MSSSSLSVSSPLCSALPPTMYTYFLKSNNSKDPEYFTILLLNTLPSYRTRTKNVSSHSDEASLPTYTAQDSLYTLHQLFVFLKNKTLTSLHIFKLILPRSQQSGECSNLFWFHVITQGPRDVLP